MIRYQAANTADLLGPARFNAGVSGEVLLQAAVAAECGEVVQHPHVVDAVVGVDAEAETGHQLDRHVQRGHDGQTATEEVRRYRCEGIGHRRHGWLAK
ncbi:hypothetical protein A6A27_30395 [Micromonospora sp. CB01531]|nr:hypothetical protein A6A27_30395 [Micromonospora sp. CB01531]